MNPRQSPNLVCALILWRSGFGLLMGKISQFLTEFSAHHHHVVGYFRILFCCITLVGHCDLFVDHWPIDVTVKTFPVFHDLVYSKQKITKVLSLVKMEENGPYVSGSLKCLNIQCTIFALNIGTPYLLTILVLNFEIVNSTSSWCVKNIAVCMANIVDPDQTPYTAASDLHLHCM